jgi:hypothetical protein
VGLTHLRSKVDILWRILLYAPQNPTFCGTYSYMHERMSTLDLKTNTLHRVASFLLPLFPATSPHSHCAPHSLPPRIHHAPSSSRVASSSRAASSSHVATSSRAAVSSAPPRLRAPPPHLLRMRYLCTAPAPLRRHVKPTPPPPSALLLFDDVRATPLRHRQRRSSVPLLFDVATTPPPTDAMLPRSGHHLGMTGFCGVSA